MVTVLTLGSPPRCKLIDEPKSQPAVRVAKGSAVAGVESRSFVQDLDPEAVSTGRVIRLASERIDLRLPFVDEASGYPTSR